MSGVVGAVGKVFATVGTAAARVGSAVMNVGASVFSSGAATGAPSLLSGGFGKAVSKLVGGGTLGNMLGGAMNQAIGGALIGGIGGMLTGQGFGRGAMAGALGGAVTGAMSGAGLFGQAMQGGASTMGEAALPDPGGTIRMAPNAQYSLLPNDMGAGMAGPSLSATQASATPMPPPRPTDLGSAAAAPTMTPLAGQGAATGLSAGRGAQPQGNGLFSFLNSPMGGNLIAGIGKGLQARQEAQNYRDLLAMRQAHDVAMNERVRENYRVDPSAYAGMGRYQYDPAQGRIVRA